MKRARESSRREKNRRMDFILFCFFFSSDLWVLGVFVDGGGGVEKERKFGVGFVGRRLLD